MAVTFNVERSLNGISGWSQIATGIAYVSNFVTYDDSMLTPCTVYYYRVRATDGVIFSSYSNIAHAKTQCPGALGHKGGSFKKMVIMGQH